MSCAASCCTALGRVIAGLGVLRSCAHIVAARAVANLAAGCICAAEPATEMGRANLGLGGTSDEQGGWQCSGWCCGERAGPT